MTNSARSDYELRIVDPSKPEQAKATAKTIGSGLLSLAIGGWGAPDPAKVELHIIERHSRRVVVHLREDRVTAQRLATDIADDLDRLDAAGFAQEWGITPSA